MARENCYACGNDARPTLTVQCERTTPLLWSQCSNRGYGVSEPFFTLFIQGKLLARKATSFPLSLLLGDRLNLAVISLFSCCHCSTFWWESRSMLLNWATPSVTVSISSSGTHTRSSQQPAKRWEEGCGEVVKLCCPHKQPC